MNVTDRLSKERLQAVVAIALNKGNGEVWEPLMATDVTVGVRSRDIFTYLLALYQSTDQDLALARVEPLMVQALSMQLQDENGLWNFKWVTTDSGLTDANAVEFCMRGAVLLWQHRKKIPPSALRNLTLMMNRSADTCLAFNIPEKYTNIALMNAMNLILLGEALDRPEIADAGYTRLDQICVYTWQWGIHEYTSPTYTGIQLYCLMFAQELCKNKRAKDQLEGLILLLLSLVAVDRGSSINPVMGANSRKVERYTTPYYSLDDSLNYMLWAIGWWPNVFEYGDEMYLLYAALASHWMVRAGFFISFANQLSISDEYPRYIQYAWGPEEQASKIHGVWSDVSLSCSGARYDDPDNQGMPLTVDFPSLYKGPIRPQSNEADFPIRRDNYRAYFVPQFNGDPFGVTGSHHFAPFFWCGTQSQKDALGMACYNNTTHNDLKSYFVLPESVTKVWIGDRLVYPRSEKAPLVEPFDKDDVLVCAIDSIYIGVRIVWMQSWGVQEASAELSFVGEAIQLVVSHEAAEIVNEAGVALWVRVKEGKESDDDNVWKEAFRKAKIEASDVQMTDGKIQKFEFAVEGQTETLHLDGVRTYEDVFATHVVPNMSDALLDFDGKSSGACFLEDKEPIQSYLNAQENLKAITILDQPVYWPAKDGFVTSPLEVTGDGGVGLRGSFALEENDVGNVTWRVHTQSEGTFYLWARLSTPGLLSKPPFLVRLFHDSHDHPSYRLSWFVQSDVADVWCPLTADATGTPEPLKLPKGDTFIQAFIRPLGAEVQELCLTADAHFKPGSD